MNETPDPSTPPPPSADSPPPPGRGRRLGLVAPVLVAILVVAAVASTYYFFTRGSRGRPARSAGVPAPGKTCIAVFPMEPSPGAEEAAWIGQAAYRFLPLALEENVDLRVLTPERIQDLSHGNPPSELSAQREVAKRAGAGFLLRGEVSGKSSEATLKLSWIEVGSGREADAWSVEGIEPANLGRKLDEIQARLRHRLRLESPDPSESPLASLVPVKEAPTRSYLEASALMDKRDNPQCLKVLSEALTLPDFHLARFLQAEAAARAGDRRTALEAATLLSKVSRPLPIRVTLLTPVIQAIYGSGNPRGAVTPLESFLARFPDEKYPLSWLGAIEVLLLDQPQSAREHLQRSLDLDPSNADARRLLGQATLEAGDAAGSVPLLEESLKSRPDDEGTALLLADALRQTGRLEESRKVAEEVLARRPESVRAVELLGSVFLAQGKVKEAEEAYSRLARSRQPGPRAEGEVLMGGWALLQGKFSESLRHYRAAVDLAAQSGDRVAQGRYLLELAEVQSSLGRNAEALSSLAEIRTLDTRADPDLAMINVVVSQKQYDTARKLLDEQASRWQGRVPASVMERLRNSLEGTIALEKGDYKEAVKRIEASLPESGKEPADSEALGRAYLGSGDAARAEQVFRRITGDPNRFQNPVRYVGSLVRLGEACEKLGKKDEAMKYYREALDWWGNAEYSLPEAAQAREGVKRLGGE